jgi:hypothetical protein
MLAVSGCTVETAWAGWGTEGHHCFPDNTCDPGLVCVGGVCRRPGGGDGGGGDFPPGLDSPAFPDLRPTRDQGCASPPAPPVLAPYPPVTPHSRVPLKGSAPGAVRVRCSGAGTSPITVPVRNNGFCVLQPLRDIPSPQIFTLVALDAANCPSRPVTATVTRGTIVGPVNLLAGLLGVASSNSATKYSGKLANLTDGNRDSKVLFTLSDTTSGCDNFTFVTFDLKFDQILDRVVVRYPRNSRRYLACYSLATSTVAKPRMPVDINHADWQEVQHARSYIPGDLTIMVPAGKNKARHVALLMFENGESNPWTEYFDITEIEAVGMPAPPACD